MTALPETGGDGRAPRVGLAAIAAGRRRAGVRGRVRIARPLPAGRRRSRRARARACAGRPTRLLRARAGRRHAGRRQDRRHVRRSRWPTAGAWRARRFRSRAARGRHEPEPRCAAHAGRRPFRPRRRPAGDAVAAAGDAAARVLRAGRRTARTALLEVLPQMRGQFEKPKYFNYNPEICAHGRSGKRGCTVHRRMPGEAIVSIGETVAVNPYLCQGGGCATVCPAGR